MTLDPVHVDGIAALASQLERTVADDDHDRLAERVWESFLDPLRADDEVVLEPVDERERHRVDIEAVALIDPPFASSHGLDAGTLNPTTYRNGAVVDVAHAAIAREPSDHELHRSRSIVGAVHMGQEQGIGDEEWSRFDDGYCRQKWIPAPPVDRFAEAVTHSLALYSAESSHAQAHLAEVDDLLMLDGPIYPKELLRWQDRHRELRDRLVSEPLPGEIVTNYLELVENSRDVDMPVIGFVKNPASNRLTRTLRRSGLPAPWRNDAGLFRRILAPAADPESGTLAYTNWFHSRAGTDGSFTADGGILELDVPSGAGVTFMTILDPRDGAIYRVEAPAWVTADAERRDRVTGMVLRGVAAERGPPRAIAKADGLARIGRGERRSLRDVIASRWDTEVDRTYDDRRWGLW